MTDPFCRIKPNWVNHRPVRDNGPPYKVTYVRKMVGPAFLRLVGLNVVVRLVS